MFHMVIICTCSYHVFSYAAGVMSTLAKELGFLARRDLSLVLNQQSPRGNDWRGLVDKMGFSYQLNMVLSQQDSPTLALLEEWERTFGELCVWGGGGGGVWVFVGVLEEWERTFGEFVYQLCVCVFGSANIALMTTEAFSRNVGKPCFPNSSWYTENFAE